MLNVIVVIDYFVVLKIPILKSLIFMRFIGIIAKFISYHKCLFLNNTFETIVNTTDIQI